MRNYLFLSVLFIWLISGKSVSQTLEMDWGQSSDLQKNYWYQKIIGNDKDGFFAIQSPGITGINEENIKLDYFSSTMNSKESSNQIIMPSVGGTATHFEDIFYMNSKIILFSSAVSGSNKILYVSYLNSDGYLKNKPRDIGSIPVSNASADGFSFKITETGKILITFHNTFAQYNGEPFTFKIINSDLTEEINYSLELPLKGRSFEMLHSITSKSNDVYMLMKAEKAADKKKSEIVEYEYIVIVYTSKKKEFTTFKVNADKYVASNVTMGLDLNGNIVAGGFCSNKTAKIPNEFIGVFYNRFNPNTLKTDPFDPKKNTRLFSKELMAEFPQKRNGETPDQYFNYLLKDIAFFQNGGFAFVAEQYYTTSTTIITPGTKKETVINYYFYNDLLVCGANKDGVLDWQIRIPKNQVSSDDFGYYHSVATFTDANKLKIIFNDNRSNLNNKVPDKTKELKNNPTLIPKGQAILATLYSDGSYEKYPMFKDEDSKYVIVPRLITKAGKRYLAYAQDGKSIKFGSFVFE